MDDFQPEEKGSFGLHRLKKDAGLEQTKKPASFIF
jgi:hypothetical protein